MAKTLDRTKVFNLLRDIHNYKLDINALVSVEDYVERRAFTALIQAARAELEVLVEGYLKG